MMVPAGINLGAPPPPPRSSRYNPPMSMSAPVGLYSSIHSVVYSVCGAIRYSLMTTCDGSPAGVGVAVGGTGVGVSVGGRGVSVAVGGAGVAVGGRGGFV